MARLVFVFLFLLLFSFGCNQQTANQTSVSESAEKPVPAHADIRGGLLLSRFQTFEEFKQVVELEYLPKNPYNPYPQLDRPMVILTHTSGGQTVSSVLKVGVSETDFIRAKDGGLWDKILLGINSPYAALSRNDLLRVAYMARRRNRFFGEGDVAFYDLAETMVRHIREEELPFLDPKDLSEKGYLNTFNHMTAQAFTTSIFSEALADFIADSHERRTMPALITGDFTEEQMADIDFGAVDNYVDIINNEWGQELGKILKKRYNISRRTHWTPELLTQYCNDLQNSYSWSMGIGMHPFRPTDELMIRFSSKINDFMDNLDQFK